MRLRLQSSAKQNTNAPFCCRFVEVRLDAPYADVPFSMLGGLRPTMTLGCTGEEHRAFARLRHNPDSPVETIRSGLQWPKEPRLCHQGKEDAGGRTVTYLVLLIHRYFLHYPAFSALFYI